MSAPPMKLPRPVQVRHGTLAAYTNWGCRCRSCTDAQVGNSRKNRAKDPAHARRTARKNHLQRMYGITLEDEAKMREAQNGLCKICLRPLDGHPPTGVDHDHATSIVRGMLDAPCNIGLGKFEDDPVRLRRAARYVETSGRMDALEPGIGAGLL